MNSLQIFVAYDIPFGHSVWYWGDKDEPVHSIPRFLKKLTYHVRGVFAVVENGR